MAKPVHAPDPAAEAAPEIEQLGPQPDPSSWEFVRAQIQVMGSAIDPGTIQLLVETHPQYRDQILAAAHAQHGNAAVNAALRPHNINPVAAADEASSSLTSPGVNPVAATNEASSSLTGAPPINAAELVQEKDEGAPVSAPHARAKAPDDWDTIEARMATGMDADMIAAFLKAFPQYRQRIIDAATGYSGPDVVAAALKIADAPPKHQQADEPQAAPAVPAVQDAGPKPGDAPAATNGEVRVEDKPAWVNQADEYNIVHQENVDELVKLVGNSCCYDDNTAAVDPVKVAAWQKAHHLHADGKVGPHTLKAARKELKHQAKLHGTTEDEEMAVNEETAQKEAV